MCKVDSPHRESGAAFRNAFLLKPQVRCTWDHTNNLRTEPTHTDARARRPSRTPHGTRRPAQEQPRPEPVAAPHLPFPRPVHVCIHVISNTSGDRTGSPRCLFTTHTGHTGHADAQRHTDHTDEPHNHPNPVPTTHTQHVSATTEAAADSTAAGPEPTAPRGRLRRGRPQQTRPCLHPLPERLPAPARKRSAK
jgi:hypothetical protein